ncbi:MAG: hypothetical protein BroJett011_31690 [Chloroflexota bacterium]|nr:MAG: hypothetical protein BroJett011_31690 [Chloroflexota bacterium]
MKQSSAILYPRGLRTLRAYQLAKQLAHSELGSYIEFSQEREFLKPTDESLLLDLYNHTWNTVGALIASLQEKKLDGSWNRTLKEDQEVYDV